MYLFAQLEVGLATGGHLGIAPRDASTPQPFRAYIDYVRYYALAANAPVVDLSGVNAAIAQHNQDTTAHASANFVKHVGAGGEKLIVGGLPSGTNADAWRNGTIHVSNSGTDIWVEPAQVAQIPEPTPPVDPVPGGSLDLSFQDFAANYLPSTTGANPEFAPTIPLSSKMISEALIEAVLAKNQTKFDQVYAWAEKNMIRSKSGSGQTTYLDGYGSVVAANGSVSDWKIDSGAEVKIGKALITAWNTWNNVKHKDGASKKAALILSLTTLDEGRRYIRSSEGATSTSSGHLYLSLRTRDFDLAAFRMFKTFTGDTRFDEMISAGLHMFEAVTSTSGPLPTTKGLPPAYVAYGTAEHAYSEIKSGTNGWTINSPIGFNSDAQEALANLIEDAKAYNQARTKALLTGNLRAFYIEKWATGTITDGYNHDGTVSSTAQSAYGHYLAINVLALTNSADTTAAAIRSAKIPGLPTSGRQYLPNQVKGVTPVSTWPGDVLGWMGVALDTGRLTDLGVLGPNPNAGTTTPVTGGGTNTNPTGPVIIPDPVIPQPAGAAALFVNPGSTLMAWYNELPTGTKKTRVGFSALKPMAKWVGGWDPNAASWLEYVNAAKAAGKIPQGLMYNIPGLDFSGGYSSGSGAQTFDQYKALVTKFCDAIGTYPCIVTYEPDSLPDLDALPADKRAGRVASMTWAIAEIRRRCPNVYLYVDAGHSAWKTVADTVRNLKEIHSEVANGIAVNTSNTQPFNNEVAFAQAICARFPTGFNFIVDTGRNGNNNQTYEWCNPPDRQYGRDPLFGGPAVTGIPRCDGWLWNKTPGEADGPCNGWGGAAGALFQDYVFKDGVADNAAGAGMAQRPPAIAGSNQSSNQAQDNWPVPTGYTEVARELFQGTLSDWIVYDYPNNQVDPQSFANRWLASQVAIGLAPDGVTKELQITGIRGVDDSGNPIVKLGGAIWNKAAASRRGGRWEYRIRYDASAAFAGVGQLWVTDENTYNPWPTYNEFDITEWSDGSRAGTTYNNHFSLTPNAPDHDIYKTPTNVNFGTSYHDIVFEWEPGVYTAAWCDGVKYADSRDGTGLVYAWANNGAGPRINNPANRCVAMRPIFQIHSLNGNVNLYETTPIRMRIQRIRCLTKN